jgi:D-inositol-3-phosphate glycosyltransferase
VKILIVSHYFSPHVGGIEIVAQNQASQLVKKGNEVSILTSAIGLPTGLTKHKNNFKIQAVRASNIFEAKMGVPFPIFSPAIITKTYQLVKACDVVHIHDAFYISSFWASFWAKILKKPVVLTQHVAMIPHPNKIVTLVQSIVYKTTGKFIFKQSSFIILFNSSVKDFLTRLKIDSKKIVMLPNGTDLKLFWPANKTEKNKIKKVYSLPTDRVLALFVGRFVPKKGFHKVLASLDANYTIVMVGGEPPIKYKKDSRVFFIPYLNQEALAEIYRACDIFVLPSEAEGFPLSIQEAMASGLPIVTSDNEGYTLHNFDRTLFKFINPTIKEIKKSLNILTNDLLLRDAMSKYSAEYARLNFSWENNIEKILSLYKEALS